MIDEAGRSPKRAIGLGTHEAEAPRPGMIQDEMLKHELERRM